MIVTFYTSRVLLNALGIDDYGIYNVVGGIVVLLSFLTNTFSDCTQRFLSFEMGEGGEKKKMNEIFSMSITLNMIICIIFVLFAESIGLWILNYKLVIPAERFYAASWVYQLSIISTIVTIMSAPYNAVVIAHERMKVFAYISVLEGILKLLIAFIICYTDIDKLIFYAILILLTSLIIRFFYLIYCKYNFSECKYSFIWNQDLFVEMSKFAGWNIYGNFSFVVVSQGTNMLLNVFFGPAVNAARAVASQIQVGVQNLAINFASAASPQITQGYAQKKYDEIFNTVFSFSKLSYYLVFICSLPIIGETSLVLKIWLVQVPLDTIIFTRLVLIQMLFRVLQNYIHILMHASGKMKFYQFVDGTLILMNIPISYYLLSKGAEAYIVFVVSIVITVIELFVLLKIANRFTNMQISEFVKRVLCPVFYVSVLSVLWYIIIDHLLISFDFISIIFKFILLVIGVLILIYWTGLTKIERLFIANNLFHKE